MAQHSQRFRLAAGSFCGRGSSVMLRRCWRHSPILRSADGTSARRLAGMKLNVGSTAGARTGVAKHAHWAIADAVTDDLLGRVSLKNMDLMCGQGSVAYWTMPTRRGQDVASSAVEALTHWAFDDVGFHRLELTHSVHNLPSCRVAIKTGFDFEGVKRRAGLHLDGWHDMHLHARINDD